MVILSFDNFQKFKNDKNIEYIGENKQIFRTPKRVLPLGLGQLRRGCGKGLVRPGIVQPKHGLGGMPNSHGV